jgi:protein STU2
MSEEEEWAQLSLPDQFQHKNWKARKGGYETATKEFKTAQPNDPLLREFILDSGLWKGAVADSNVAAQQEALNAYNAFLDAAGAEGARKTRGVTIQGVVEKGLTGRPAAKASALESLLLLIELDRADPVIEELLPFLSHKQPKIIAATLSALTSIYHAYGCKTVEPKPVIKLLPKVFGHADKNVRAEAQNVTVEFYRWLRDNMKPLFWGELKDVQQKDLEKLFEPVKAEPQPKQERLLRSQQAAQEEAAAVGGGGDGDDGVEGEEEGGEIDLEPEYEAVDVFAKIPKDFNERLGSTKWKDRKEALDETLTAVNVPAMQEGPFDDVLRGCAKSMKDANIAVVTVAANVVECIAKGLRKSFTKYRGTVLGPMLERFKEKKVSVTDAIGAACDAVFMATGFGEVEADVLEALKNKNPQVKENTAKFLVRSLKSTREAPSLEQTKEFAEAGKKLLTESVASLRDAGAEIVGVLWKIMGDRNMLNHLEGLDDIRKNKIKEFSDAAEVRAKWKPKTAPAPKSAAPAAAAGRKPALGGKRPPAAGVKRAPPPKAASPTPQDDAPLQPRPTSRPVSKGPAGLRPPGGLKAPGSGLAKPGSGLKAPGSGAASPKRQSVPPPADEPPAAAPKSGLGRGLAGRPLGKPLTAPSSPPPTQRSETPASSALSSIERQELSDLRAEVDLLRNQTSDLRTDKLRLTSQIAELQNQNAQLIEDHTRDVLQIKAKETQLVRARSDAENAEERANSLSKEIDRLKREMSRLNRGTAATANGSNGGGARSPDFGTETGFGGDASVRPAYGTSRSYNVPSARAYGDVGNGFAPSSIMEGKENIPDTNNHYAGADGKLSSAFSAPPHTQRAQGNPSPARPMSNGSSGGLAGSSSDGDAGMPAKPTMLDRSQSDGVESWRRAAEVTQNLKARIEMMKVSRTNSSSYVLCCGGIAI